MKLKRFVPKTVSAILIISLLLQLLPPGWLLQPASASRPTTSVSLQDPSDTVTLRTNNTVTAEIPETFIDQTEEITPDPSEEQNADVELNSDSDTEASEWEAIFPSHINSPYSYSYDDNETVSLNTGALIYENIDYVLPGVNGLDLVIGRRYNSQASNIYTPRAELYNPSFWVHYAIITRNIYLPDSDEPIAQELYEIKGPYNIPEQAEAYYDEYHGKTEVLDSSTGKYAVYFVEVIMEKEDPDLFYVRTVLDPNTYLNKLYGLGSGWEFMFSSIQSLYPGQFLHLSNGSCYEIDWESENPSHLKDYTLTDMKLDRYVREFSTDSATSDYRLTYQNGTREYFSWDGKLIGIIDRYGNTIKLEHSTQNGLPYIKITDTLGRITVISGTLNATGHVMTVTLPDETQLTYRVENSSTTDSALALAHFVDSAGNTTRYSYTLQSAWLDLSSKHISQSTDPNIYVNLTTITHPTLAQTVFTYTADERNLGEDGLMTVYKLASREDRIGSAVSNRVSYTYSSNDYSGYPAHSSAENLPDTFTYSASVTDSRGTVTTAFFNRDHLNTSVTAADGTRTLQETLYEYNANKLPIKTTARLYNENGACMETVEAVEYDGKGNVVAQWSSLANGDTANTEHKITYTYDSTYGLPLTQTYKTNASTTVRMENTLDESKKNIVTTAVYVNDTLTRKTDYAYDSYGNVTQQKQYLDDMTDYVLTEYAYQNGAYLTQEKHTGLVTADGTPAASTPGQSSGTIITTHTYDSMGRRLSTTDGNGNTTSYTYDAIGNVTSVINPDDTSVTYNRNYTANLVTVTDENGASLIYTYNPLGLEYEIVDSQTNGVITRKEYDSSARLSKVTDFVYGSVTEYTYDVFDRVTSETTRQGDVVLSQTLYSYDDAAENGLYQKVTKTVVGDANAPSIITTQYTDKHGNTVKSGKMLNDVEYCDVSTFDYVGNVLSTLTAADAERDVEYSSRFVYNEANQVVTAYNALGQSTTNTYDALGNLVRATDYAGTPTTYTYDALGRLLTQTFTIEDGITAFTKYEYDPAGNLIREYKPTNAVGETATWAKTEYTYNNRGRLTAVIQYEGEEVASVTRYTYDGVGNTLTMTTGLDALEDTTGSTTTYTYDRFGNVLTTTDALGKTETNHYSALGRLDSTTDRNNTVTAYAYDALGRVRLTSAGGNLLQYTYTLAGQVRSEQSGSNLTQYTYDELGRVTRVDEAPAGAFEPAPEAAPDPETPVYAITLDPSGGFLPSGAQGLIWLHPGDDVDLPTPIRTGYTFKGWYLGTTQMNNTSAAQLTQNCVLTADWDPITYYIEYDVYIYGTSATPPETQTCIYDEPVTLAGIVRTSDFRYYFGSWTLQLPGFTYTFDAGATVKNLSSENGTTITLRGVLTSDYDPGLPLPIPSTGINSIQSTEDDAPFTYTKTYTYDLSGNRTGMTVTQGNTTVQAVTYTYDTLNRLSTVSESGNLRATYTYDTNGNRASLTYANGVAENYQYNLANWITSLVNCKGSETLSSYAYTYYASGSQKSETDYNGVVTSYVYDDLGRLTRESENGGQTITYTYDANGNRIILAASGSPMVTPDPPVITLDPAGGSLPEGASTTVLIPVSEGYSLPAPVRPMYSFAGWYLDETLVTNDDLSQIVESCTLVAHWSEVPILTLDLNGGLLPVGTSTQIPLPVSEGYALPTPGRLGYTFTGWYLGDTLVTDDDLAQITESCTLVAHWEEGGGIVIEPPIVGGNTYTIVYSAGSGTGFMPMQMCPVDEWVALAENEFTKEGESFFGWTIGGTLYYPGQLVMNLADAGESVTLHAVWSGDGIINPPIDPDPPSLEYRALSTTDTSVYTTTYAYDANNRLIREVSDRSGSNVLVTYTYDDNGNLLSQLDVDNTAVVTHAYNGFNQLVTSVTGEGTITYTYNAQGIRTSRTVGLTTTHYLLDGGNVIGEVEGDAATTYLRGVNLISSNGTYYLYNAHGDVVQLTNTNGELTRNYNYDAFGNEREPDETDSNPFRYCGEYYDTETGLYYLRARYYDPLIGRFTQEDTHWNTANMIYGDNPQKINEREDALGLKTYSYAPQISAVVQSGNLYVYAANNPVVYADPSGGIILSTLALLMIGGALIGGAIGGTIGYNKATQSGLAGWDKAHYTINGALFGGIIGSLGGYLLAPFVVSVTGIAGFSISASGIVTLTPNAYEIFKALEHGVNFAAEALKHMQNPGRFVPVQILMDAIKYGNPAPDPQGSNAIMYTIEIIRNGKTYILEVLYDLATNTIWHFLYK